MLLVAGLGNPGAEYAATRHNIGFMAIDSLADGARFTSKFHSDTASIERDGEKLILLKPQTYMNNSGRAVQAAMAFYKLPPSQVIVLHDELDLPPGKLRIKKGGGANGQNGVRDIDACIGQDYWRIRLGIAHPGDKERVTGHVLGRFTAEERAATDKLLQALAQHFSLFWQHSPEALMSKISDTLNPPIKKPATKAAPADTAGGE